VGLKPAADGGVTALIGQGAPQSLNWVQGLDLNQRPSGYEPDELPGCSTLQQMRKKTVPKGKTLSICFIILAVISRLRKRTYEVTLELPMATHAHKPGSVAVFRGHDSSNF
jgi:hypothetical protein